MKEVISAQFLIPKAWWFRLNKEEILYSTPTLPRLPAVILLKVVGYDWKPTDKNI